MKDFLQDLVSHTHSLGYLPLLKVTSSDEFTQIDSIAESRHVILYAKTHAPVPELSGVFGMGNLNTLDYMLKCNMYKENATISLTTDTRNGTVVPSGIHFQNETGDFENDYRFMSSQLLDMKMKIPNFSKVPWHIEVTPSLISIQKFKYQASASTDETLFKISTDSKNLIFSFGDATTHAGSFVFEMNVSGTLRQPFAGPKNLVLSVLNLQGDKTMKISNDGALQITVDSGIIEYNYIFPAHSI